MALQLFDEQDLIRISTCQSVRRMYVEPIKGTRGGLIAQPLQGRAEQSAATVAFIKKAQFFLQVEAIIANACLERLHLAGNGLCVGLLLRRHTGIERDAETLGHRQRPGSVIHADLLSEREEM